MEAKEEKVTEETPAKEKGARERILEASLELFVHQGYFNTNVPDISKRSKCSVGSIYHHFLNKEEIAGLLYRDGILQFRKALSETISKDPEVDIAVPKLVNSFLSFAESHQLLSRYLWLSRHEEFLNSSVKRPTVVGFDSLGRKLTKVIKNGVRSGKISNVKAEIFWSIVFGIPMSFVRDWLEGYTAITPSEAAPTLSKACWSALKSIS